MTWRKEIKVESIQANKSKNFWLSVTSCLPYVQNKRKWDEKQDKCSQLKNFCSEGVATWAPACLHLVPSGSHICCLFPLFLFINLFVFLSFSRRKKKKRHVFFLRLCFNRAENFIRYPYNLLVCHLTAPQPGSKQKTDQLRETERGTIKTAVCTERERALLCVCACLCVCVAGRWASRAWY